MKETDLYYPVKELLESLGYSVISEVKSIDVVGSKESDFIFFELKTSLTMKLLLQGIERQKLGDNVYLAIPKPISKKRFARDVKQKETLVKKLNLGLIYINISAKKQYAEIVFPPTIMKMNKNTRMLNSIKKEISNRSDDNNVGGTNKEIITAYKEYSLKLAKILSKQDKMNTREIRTLSQIPNSTTIMYNNFYGWFNRVDRGYYSLNQSGKNALKKYKTVVKKL